MENHTGWETGDNSSENSENSAQEEGDEVPDLPIIKPTEFRLIHQGKLPPLYPEYHTPQRCDLDNDDSPPSLDQSKVPEIRVTGARGSIHPVQIDQSPSPSHRDQSMGETAYSDIVNFNKGQKYRKRLDLLSIFAGIIAAAVMVIGAISYVFQPYIYNTAIGLWGGGLILCFGIYGATTLVHCKHDCRFPIYHAYTGICIAIVFSCGLIAAFCISLGFDKQYLFCTYKDGVGDCGTTDDIIPWRVPPNYKFASARIWLECFGLFFSVVLVLIHGYEFVCVQKLGEIEHEEEKVEMEENDS
jgi:hypothetical protein